MSIVKDETFELTDEVSGTPEEVVARLPEAFRSLATPMNAQNDGASGGMEIHGVMGAGFQGKNPASLTVRIQPLEGGRSHVTVTASAKEGLIKQRTAEKAVRGTFELLHHGQ